jgi:TonB family protein
MQARIQGSVWVTAVVWSTGEVRNVTVVRSLDKELGLDDEAIKAMLQWKFEPGTRDGKPVPVEITVEFTFTLK